MRQLTFLIISSILLLTIKSNKVEAANNETRQEVPSVSVIVFGRSGCGISSTVRELLGTQLPPRPPTPPPSSPEEAKPLLTEYKVPVPSTTSEELDAILKIVDVEGVADNRTPEQDALILATLKTYLKTQGQDKPTAFLIVSCFDDSRFAGEHSLYVQMLKRIVLLQEDLYHQNNSTSASISASTKPKNILFFSRLLSETKETQRSPKIKLGRFKAIASEYNSVFSSAETLVGENNGADYDLPKDESNLWWKLPERRQFYPKNLLLMLIKITNNPQEKAIFQRFIDQRGSTELAPAESKAFPGTGIGSEELDPNDVTNFARKIRRTGRNELIQDNEVNTKIQQAFDSMEDALIKVRISDLIPTLQIHLQSNNLTQFADLPVKILEKVKFFKALPVSGSQIPDIVSLFGKALNFTMPHFVQSPIVGHGYDIMKDETLPSNYLALSPMQLSTWKPSSLGYLLPSFLTCSAKITSKVENFKTYLHYDATQQESLAQRQKYLNFPQKEQFNLSSFEGQVRLGFNVKPEANEIASLSAVKEIRLHKLELNSKLELNQEFLEGLDSLEGPFNSGSRDSVKEWKAWFNTWGTHIVSSAYVGGFIQGSILGGGLKEVLSNGSQVNSILEKLVNFTKVELDEGKDGITFYGVFGGEKDPKLASVQKLEEQERQRLVESWEDSLNYDPIVLTVQMGLIPISQLVKEVNASLGVEVEKSLELLLQGRLNYVRIKKPRDERPPLTQFPNRIVAPTAIRPSGPTARPSRPTISAYPTRTPGIIPARPATPIPTPNYLDEESSSLEQLVEDPLSVSLDSKLNELAKLAENINGTLPMNAAKQAKLMIQAWANGNKHREMMIQALVNSTLLQTKRYNKQTEENKKRLEAEYEETKIAQQEKLKEIEKARLQDQEERQAEKELRKERQEEEIKQREEGHRKQIEALEAQAQQFNQTMNLILELRKKQQEEQERINKETGFIGKAWNGILSIF